MGSYVHPDARVIVLADCCHSETIADLHKHEWAEREVISITGCMDCQTAGDVGEGGIFTHSLLYAVEALQELRSEYSVGLLYNATVKEEEVVFRSKQNITIQCTAKWDGLG